MSSLADKLAALANPEPVFADPEKEQDYTPQLAEPDVDPDDSSYLDGQRSSLRLKNADLVSADERYSGRKVSRSSILKQRGDDVRQEDGDDIREHAAAELGHMFEGQDGDDSGEEQGDDSDQEQGDDSGEDEGDELSDQEDESGEEGDEWEVEREEETDKNSSANGFVFDDKDEDFSKYGDGEESEGSDDNDEEDDDAEEDSDDDDVEDENDGEVNGIPGNVAAEVEKGVAVQQQLSVWDKLLETRIQQQKLLSRVNRLPVDQYWNKLCSEADEGFNDQIKETRKTLRALLNDLVDLEALLANPDSDEPPTKRKKMSDFSQTLTERHEAFRPVRNEIIQKWSDKTRIASGKNSFSSMETSTVLQIDQILANTTRLVDRTKLKRSAVQLIGRDCSVGEESGLNETDADIFDDDDFYHQLLRDLIDRKTSTSTDQSQVTRQWLEVQKLRTKLKKKVDTKASKGRKVRYDIHAKLVNFMAPVFNHNQNEQTKDELFKSLFGARV